MRNLFFALLASVPFLGISQSEIPKDYFKNPLNIPIILAGSFGELRSNHFHSGLDIKTQHRTGMPVGASAAGKVVRINVQRYGYGKALYIQHPNGYTTVYAHLSSFGPEIEAYVKKQQYKKESYSIELFPSSTALPVEQGQLIAYSGNTGGSTAPHLHFEIRDGSARPMNAMLFGIEVPDSRRPIISDLLVYPLSGNSQVNQSQFRQNLRFTKQDDGMYKSEKITAYGPLGFGIATIDQQDGAPNKNGTYKISTSLNGKETLEVTMNRFSFAETRYLNRMIDYEYYEKERSRVQKLFIERNNPLSIYTLERDKGILNLTEDGASYVYTITAQDLKGNTTTLLVPIEVKNEEILAPNIPAATDYPVRPESPADFSLGRWRVYIPKNAFYDNYFLDVSVKDDVLHLHEDIIPVAKYMTIRYDASNYSPADREKLYIGLKGYGKYINYTGASLEGTTLKAITRSLGDYTVAMDTTPPEIKAIDVKEGKWMSKYNTLDLKISDEESGINEYRATINGKFILMEYEYKTGMLTYDFSDKVNTETENHFKLIVTDNVGNSSTFTTTFFRKDIL